MFIKNNSFTKKIKNINLKNKGFTLAEMVIVTFIVTVLMSVVLFNYGTFNDKLALSSAGQEIALAIREAQTYGINVKQEAVDSDNFGYPYGIVFYSLNGGVIYQTFLDKNFDGVLASPGCYIANEVWAECTGEFILNNNIVVDCVGKVGDCPSESPLSYILNITFRRPSTDALINPRPFYPGTVEEGIIRLKSPKGRTLDIIITVTGQVYVQ